MIVPSDSGLANAIFKWVSLQYSILSFCENLYHGKYPITFALAFGLTIISSSKESSFRTGY
jgi:hypothetical protein